MAIERHMRVVDCGTEEGEEEEKYFAVKVAFATTDMECVNQHFGSAQSFAIYCINPDEVKFLEAAQFGKLEQDGNEDKLAVKIALLQGCAAVYCQAVGSSAVRQLIAKGIQPVKVSEGSAINRLIEELQAELRAGPSAWLAKAIQRGKGTGVARFDTMEAEGWEE